MLGLLAGEGDFGKSLCIAVNCGNDTDCTGATLGALLGILYPDGIDEKWTKPIGNKLVLGGNMIAMHEVETIDEMCDQIAALSQEVQRFYGSQVRTVGAPDFGAHTKEISRPWKASPDGVGIACDYNQRESVIARLPVYTTVVYPPQVSIALGKSPPTSCGSRTYRRATLSMRRHCMCPTASAWNPKPLKFNCADRSRWKSR